MDPILRTALDWFVEQAHASARLGQVHEALQEMRVKIDKLPSRFFYLESPDEPYTLPEILMTMGKHALAWQGDPAAAIERKLLAPQVEEILEKAIALRELLGRGAALPRMPAGEIRRSLETRGEPLPDRL